MAAIELMHRVMMRRAEESLFKNFHWTRRQVAGAMRHAGGQFALIWNSDEEASVDQARQPRPILIQRLPWTNAPSLLRRSGTRTPS